MCNNIYLSSDDIEKYFIPCDPLCLMSLSIPCPTRRALPPPRKPTAYDELEAQVADYDGEFTVEEMVTQLSRSLRVPADLMPALLRLPSTAGGFAALQGSAEGLNSWRSALSQGLLPQESVGWPGDAVFRSALLGTLADLDMAKFTRRHPALLTVLLKNVLEVLQRYEQAGSPF